MGTPSWWSAAMPELVHRRELMQNVEKWQTMYVRYKCQPEAQVTQTGWDLSMSQRYADQLALEEQQPYLSEESLLYNGLAPTNIALRIVEAPAEFAVPVKQDRRLTPNFKARVEVTYKNRCSFPLTLKAYVISQQEKDSVPEWVPDDFLDPDLPQRKPVTELKGTTVITHHFEGTAGGSPKHGASKGQSNQLRNLLTGALGDNAAAAQALLAKGADPALLASMGLGDVDPCMLEQVLQGTEAHMSHDYEFSSVELVKPTRMNKVYLVFACSILEQDLMFVVYNIPTVGICRAEQRAKACQKLNVSYAELGGVDDMFNTNPSVMGMGQPTRSLNLPNGMPQQRKRGSAPGWGDPTMMGMQGVYGDGVMGLGGSDMNLAALAAGGIDPSLGLGMGMQMDSMMVADGAIGMMGGMQAMRQGLGMEGEAQPRSRQALRELLIDEYASTGLHRKLSALDIQALESQAGFPIDPSGGSLHVTISQQQWDEFTGQYKLILKLLRQIANVWNLEDPCVIAGFDMDRLGTIQALSQEPVGTFICRFSMSQLGCLVLSCKVADTHPNADENRLLHAIIKLEDLFERRVETWMRDFAGATHILDVYKNKRVDKRKVFTSSYTRLRAMDMLEAYTDIFI